MPLAVAESLDSIFHGDRAYRFNTEQFFQMFDTDIFPDHSRVYLWEGQIRQREVKNPIQCVASAKILREMNRLVPEGWFVGCFTSIVASPYTVAEPDFLYLRGKPDDYLTHSPTPSDVGLIVEISHADLGDDLGPKMAGYATARLPIYWVANLIDNVIVEHREPVPDEGRYASIRTYSRGDLIALKLDGVDIGPFAVLDLLPIE